MFCLAVADKPHRLCLCIGLTAHRSVRATPASQPAGQAATPSHSPAPHAARHSPVCQATTVVVPARGSAPPRSQVNVWRLLRQSTVRVGAGRLRPLLLANSTRVPQQHQQHRQRTALSLAVTRPGCFPTHHPTHHGSADTRLTRSTEKIRKCPLVCIVTRILIVNAVVLYSYWIENDLTTSVSVSDLSQSPASFYDDLIRRRARCTGLSTTGGSLRN